MEMGSIWSLVPWVCPVCDSAAGERVRAGLADDLLGVSVLAIVLPFLVLSAIVAVIHLSFHGK